MKPSIRNGGLILLGLMIATAILGYLWLQTSLPQTTGSKTVHGLTAPAEIIRDENGVPHIFANTEGDAADYGKWSSHGAWARGVCPR